MKSHIVTFNPRFFVQKVQLEEKMNYMVTLLFLHMVAYITYLAILGMSHYTIVYCEGCTIAQEVHY